MNIDQRQPAIRTIAMPCDTNPAGDIFGGWLMSQMDLAAGSVAARYAQGRCATVKVEAMSFLVPVKVGDEVSVFAEVSSVGTTSMTIAIEAWKRARQSEPIHKVTQAIFTFVALDDDGRPKRILKPENLS
jgi:acyl-CoA thioesterase YciA